MTTRSLMILALTTLFLGGSLAVVKMQQRMSESDESVFSFSVGEQKLHRLRISTSDNELEIGRNEKDDWVLTSHKNLPVAQDRVNLLFQTLSLIAEGEKIEATSSYYNRLNLEIPSHENSGSSGALVEFYDEADRLHCSFVIGKAVQHRKSGGGQYSAWFRDRRYMRVIGNESEVWLLNNPLDEVSVESHHWIDPKIRFMERPKSITLAPTQTNNGAVDEVELSADELALFEKAQIVDMVSLDDFEQDLPLTFEVIDADGKLWTLGIGAPSRNERKSYLEKVSRGMLSNEQNAWVFPLKVLQGDSANDEPWQAWAYIVRSIELQNLLNKHTELKAVLAGKK